MLRSPVPSAAACSRSTSVQKPLPSPPCSVSAELPVELPGSLLLENQGFPSGTAPASARPITQIFRRETHPTDNHFEIETGPLDLLNLVPPQLIHARSVPDLRSRHCTMRSVRSGNALNSSTTAKPSPLGMQHKKSLSDTTSRRRSKQNLLNSPSSTDIGSTICDSSTSMTRGSTNDPNKARAHAKRLPQQAPRIKEEKGRNQDLEKRRSYQKDVSVIGFLVRCCVFTGSLHNETVSEALYSTTTTLMRQCAHELDVQVCHQLIAWVRMRDIPVEWPHCKPNRQTAWWLVSRPDAARTAVYCCC
jgi:hypothetical protein